MEIKKEDKMSSEFFTLLYASTVKHLKNSSVDEMNSQLLLVGEKIGHRLADDFFSKTRQTKRLNIGQILTNISETFFPLYFSFKPQITPDLVILDNFYLLEDVNIKHLKGVKYLNLIVGILQVVYSYLSDTLFLIEDVTDEEGFKISVRKKEKGDDHEIRLQSVE